MKKIDEKIFLFVRKNNLIENGDKLLVALSGGADSVFALRFLIQKTKKLQISLEAAHLNHQLRGKDSDEDEIFCRDLCGKFNIKFHSENIDVKSYAEQNKYSLEEAARILRYDKLGEIAEQNGCSKIVTAHNLNDNTETVLYKLVKGTGLAGLSGIRTKRGKIIRPFLSVSKDEILLCLKKLNQYYRTDSTNFSNEFRRNYIRNVVIPKLEEINPSLHRTIFASSQIFGDSEKIVWKYIKEISGKYLIKKKDSLEIKDKIYFEEPEVLGAVLKEALKEKFNYSLDYENYEKIESFFNLQTGKELDLGNDLEAYKERGSVLFKKKDLVAEIKEKIVKAGNKISFENKVFGINSSQNVKIEEKNSKTELISADNTDDIFILRRWKNGDKFIPLGMKNFKKISDFLNEQKIPANKKKEQLVLINRNNIVWVVGLRIDERYKITEKTKKSYKLWIK